MSEKKPDVLRQRIKLIMPDLIIDQFEINQEGLINDVVIVNRELVFRFAKDEAAARILDGEMKILDLIRPRIDLAVPTPVYRSHDSVVYPFLEGDPLLRDRIRGMDERTQCSLAGQIGTFLCCLHATDTSGAKWEIPATLAPVTRDRWLEIRSRVERTLYPLLLRHQVQWAERLFNSVLEHPDTFDYTAALIHGDLAPYHILFDGRKGQITGVIDFGVAGLGDPALDIGVLMTNYGESFVSKIARVYPDWEAYLPRAKFYAQSIELHWVLLGLETGEDFWFAAHLGGARDIRL